MNLVQINALSARAEDGVVEIRHYPFRDCAELTVINSDINRQMTVELTLQEVAQVHEALVALSGASRRNARALTSEGGGVRLFVCYTNMGEPFREGAYVSIDERGSGVTVFLDRESLAGLAKPAPQTE